MKRIILAFLACMMMISITACNSGDAATDETVRVALLLTGNLGDMSFNDSANEGLLRAQEELGIVLTVIECDDDPAKIEPNLLDLAEDGYQIIAGTSEVKEYIELYADAYPDTVFVLFDDEVDWNEGELKNVHCILYKNNEAAFLGGFLASELSNSGLEGYNDEKIIGFLGGMDQPVINDFLIGYIEGARYSDPEMLISTFYVNSYSDSAKGKELSLVMIENGADICFNVAGSSGAGLLEAAIEKNAFVLGVDSDQAMAYKDVRPEFAEIIPSSVLKKVGDTLYRMTEQYLDSTLNLGGTDTLGIAEGAVGLADNEYYEKNVPQEIRDNLKALEETITKGQIEIGTAYNRPIDEVAAIRESVKP